MYFHLNRIKDLMGRVRAEETRGMLKESLEAYCGLDVATREYRGNLLKHLPALAPGYVSRIAPHFEDETPPAFQVWREINEDIDAKRAYVFEEKPVPLERRVRGWLTRDFDPHEISGFYIRRADQFRAEKLIGMHTDSLRYAELHICIERQVREQYGEAISFLTILKEEAGKSPQTPQERLLCTALAQEINYLVYEQGQSALVISSLTSELSRWQAQVRQARAKGVSLRINLAPPQTRAKQQAVTP